MNTERKVVRNILVFGLALSFLFIVGCHSSDEMEKGDNSSQALAPNEVNQRALNVLLLKDCKEDNDSLTRANAKLQQDLRAATARAAEMETQLAELKDHPAPAPPVEEKKVVVNAPPSGDANQTYEEGLSMFRAKEYRDALEKFQAVASEGDGSGFADRGIYWSGECRYALKDYSGALGLFKKVLGFRSSTKKDDAQMMIGNCYVALGNKAQAKTAFEKLISAYPGSPYVKRAKAKMHQM
jgi:TolA-binding protein